MFSRRLITAPVEEPPPAGDDFVMTVETTGTDESFTIIATTYGTDVYNATIDWGDGSPLSNITSAADPDLAHVYANPGIHTITISGIFAGFHFNAAADAAKIRTIEEWGNVDFTSIRNMLHNAWQMTKIGNGPISAASAGLDTSALGAFRDCVAITSIPSNLLANWTGITFTGSMFQNCNGITEIPPGLFDGFTNLTSMLSCFNVCDSLQTIPPGLFDDISDSVNFESTFRRCNISSIPANLFDKMTGVCNFRTTFQQTPVVNVPVGIFDFCVNTNYYEDAFSFCALSQNSVDNILVSLDTAGALDGIITLWGGTSSAPGPAGLTAKANLEAKGWTVETN